MVATPTNGVDVIGTERLVCRCPVKVVERKKQGIIVCCYAASLAGVVVAHGYIFYQIGTHNNSLLIYATVFSAGVSKICYEFLDGVESKLQPYNTMKLSVLVSLLIGEVELVKMRQGRLRYAERFIVSKKVLAV